MPRFFVREDAFRDGRIYISGEDARHLSKVLRVKSGEKLTVCDFFNTEYRCAVCTVSENSVELLVLSKALSENEPPFPITLYMALPKGDKMNLVVQKSVELGVSRIVPFSSAFTVVRLTEQSALEKRERWQRVAHSAAQQCGRGHPPKIETPVSFSMALADCKSRGGISFICDEQEEKVSLGDLLKNCPAPESLSFFVGAEGGFDRKEIEEAKVSGIRGVTLGKRILRCETVPLFVLSCIGYTFEL